MKLLKTLFTSPAGQFTLVGLVVLGAAFAAKVYYDQVSIPVSEIAGDAVQDQLKAMASKLDTHVAAQPEGKSPFPERAGWTPATLTCGAPTKADAKAATHPTWKVLGLDFAEPVHYQFLFYSEGKTFSLVARTDFDCDGLHQVLRIKGEHGFTGLTIGDLTVDNPGE